MIICMWFSKKRRFFVGKPEVGKEKRRDCDGLSFYNYMYMFPNCGIRFPMKP